MERLKKAAKMKKVNKKSQWAGGLLALALCMGGGAALARTADLYDAPKVLAASVTAVLCALVAGTGTGVGVRADAGLRCAVVSVEHPPGLLRDFLGRLLADVAGALRRLPGRA